MFISFRDRDPVNMSYVKTFRKDEDPKRHSVNSNDRCMLIVFEFDALHKIEWIFINEELRDEVFDYILQSIDINLCEGNWR